MPRPIVFVVILVAFTLAVIGAAFCRDLGQWNDPEMAAWYRSLKQPDTGISCCGEADSWYCSEHAQETQVYCVIDDERDDEKLMRRHIDNGTRIDIPPNKLNRDPNRAGRAIVFLSSGGYVYCFISAGGV